MGIRYEKDTILNWINEMGKFLRLLVAQWEDFDEEVKAVDIAAAYNEFFNQDRAYFMEMNEEDLIAYSLTLDNEQIRPLAKLLMYDGLIQGDRSQLLKAKALFENHMRQTGSFSFEDYGSLAEIEKYLR